MPGAAANDSLRRNRLLAVDDVARAYGAGAALLSSPAAVRWLGIERPQGVLAVVSGNDAVVVAADGADETALADALERGFAQAGIGPRDAIAVEGSALTPALARGLGDRAILPADRALDGVRARKDPDELELIVRAGELVDAGHAALRGALGAGITELALWRAAADAMTCAGGGPVEAQVDLMSGPRTALIGEPPGPRVVAACDGVLFDLAPRRDGYWADSCATIACLAARPALRRRYDAVLAALERGLQAARPGITAGDLDRTVRDALASSGLECPHHMGHGVGTAPQEPPWIVPDDPTVLEEGMVIALEPGAYAGGFGVRLERLVHIGPDGARPLTAHSLSLS
jgi:Xaa-Pro dipeptidase